MTFEEETAEDVEKVAMFKDAEVAGTFATVNTANLHEHFSPLPTGRR